MTRPTFPNANLVTKCVITTLVYLAVGSMFALAIGAI
jgi:hypothetical protein